MGLIEKIFKVFPHYKSIRAIDHLGLGQFAPKGLDWQDFKWGSTRLCHILNIYGFRFFSHNTCSYIDLLGLASSDPKGLIDRIYVGDY